jgi:membrane-bound serine protease (ClpP class)
MLLSLLGLGLPAVSFAAVPVVELRGPIQAVSAHFVVDAIHAAGASGAPLLVVQIDTPGGFDTAMREIVDAILNGPTPVAVFVSPAGSRAASAGFVILMAADIAAMSPGTNAGAAHPVLASGGQMDEVMAKKVAEDAAAYVRGKAARRGRNVALAEDAVLKSRSFTEKEALEGHLIDLVASDVPGLLAALEGREVVRFDGAKTTLHLKGEEVRLVRMGPWQAILSAIASPDAMFLLLLGALAGLGTEITHPGLVAPGVIGVLCLVLFLFAGEAIPIHGAGVLLVLLGAGFFAAEIKLTSHGLLTAAGIASIILGAMMLVDAPVPEMRIRFTTLVPAALMAAGLSAGVLRLATETRRHRPTTGSAGLLGAPGSAETALEPEGWVRVRGELWKARAAAPVVAGEAVVVTGLRGLELQVRKEAPHGT